MKLSQLLSSLAIALLFPYIRVGLTKPVSSSNSGIETSSSIEEPQRDIRQLSLPVTTIQQFDILLEELQPQPGGEPIDFDDPRYAELLDHLRDGSYIGPNQTTSASGTVELNSIPGSSEVRNKNRVGIIYYYGPKCEASNASPSRPDAREFLNIVRKTWATNHCDQDNPYGSRCRTLGKHKGVRFGICGETSDWSIRCEWLFPMWEVLVNQCGNSDGTKVGGQYKTAYKNIYPDSQRWMVNLRVQIF
ncbi:hypothetical protein BJ508DRAFT_326720 [Ascobolus immersus RN42]|uniref:Uncharacterized protein n=1 Tax=Ascobolus immersus RN42 TaxID=1160509 RepID=A0A3N4IA95_ASCIM|nr:hypothetical protein BJ508DRAFT_326720 [Ascobolus immersus RN42]